jgi:hypothetical protein
MIGIIGNPTEESTAGPKDFTRHARGAGSGYPLIPMQTGQDNAPDSTPEPTPPRGTPAPLPLLPLDYYAPATDAPRKRALTVWGIVLLAGWVPYACGVVNASTMMRAWYAPTIASAHENGAVVFLGLGAVLTLLSLAGFMRHRHTTGIVAASGVLLVQVLMGVCLGASV